MRSTLLSVIAVMVDRVRDELKIGASEGWMLVYSSGRMSTLSPKTRAIPITKVPLKSTVVDMIICIPAITIKHVTKTRIAPITGFGMMDYTPVNIGKKAKRTKMRPAAKAI